MLEANQILHQRYQLKQKLGQNAGRQTWQAEDIAVCPVKPVIVKLLAFNPEMQWDDFKLFEREANVLKQLNHPRIPKYCEHFALSDRIIWFGLIQTYIPGNSLKELLTQGKRFSESEVWNIAVSLLEILIYLHELSPIVLHRDIKPSNIILGEDQKIYLVDFGAVQARAAMEGATFTIVGTYGYTPMEQFGGRAVPASDLYALGATLIHILTGTAPADLPQQNMRIQFCEYLSTSSHLINWIKTLTDPSVEERFQTARQALAALKIFTLTHKASLDVQKPYTSRIQIKKSLYYFKAKVQKRGLHMSDSFLILGILILYGATVPFSMVTFPVALLFWLVSLAPLSLLVFFALSEVNLYFDRSYFAIEWRLLGLRYRSLKGYTSTIQSIRTNTSTLLKVTGEPLTTVAIQAENQKYEFSRYVAPISVADCQLLIQELREWLGIV